MSVQIEENTWFKWAGAQINFSSTFLNNAGISIASHFACRIGFELMGLGGAYSFLPWICGLSRLNKTFIQSAYLEDNTGLNNTYSYIGNYIGQGIVFGLVFGPTIMSIFIATVLSTNPQFAAGSFILGAIVNYALILSASQSISHLFSKFFNYDVAEKAQQGKVAFIDLQDAFDELKQELHLDDDKIDLNFLPVPIGSLVLSSFNKTNVFVSLLDLGQIYKNAKNRQEAKSAVKGLLTTLLMDVKQAHTSTTNNINYLGLAFITRGFMPQYINAILSAVSPKQIAEALINNVIITLGSVVGLLLFSEIISNMQWHNIMEQTSYKIGKNIESFYEVVHNNRDNNLLSQLSYVIESIDPLMTRIKYNLIGESYMLTAAKQHNDSKISIPIEDIKIFDVKGRGFDRPLFDISIRKNKANSTAKTDKTDKTDKKEQQPKFKL